MSRLKLPHHEAKPSVHKSRSGRGKQHHHTQQHSPPAAEPRSSVPVAAREGPDMGVRVQSRCLPDSLTPPQPHSLPPPHPCLTPRSPTRQEQTHTDQILGPDRFGPLGANGRCDGEAGVRAGAGVCVRVGLCVGGGPLSVQLSTALFKFAGRQRLVFMSHAGGPLLGVAGG